MAEDILEEISDNLDDDAMDDMVDDTLEEFSDTTEEKKSLIKKIPAEVKNFFRNIFGSGKKIIIIVLAFILLISLALGARLFFFKTGPEDRQVVNGSITTQPGIKDMQAREEKVIFEDIIDLEPFEHIQLKAGSSMGLITMTLSLELIDHRYRKQVYTMEDRIRNIITDQAEEMTWLELKNPEGKIMLKYSLLKRINSIFPKATIRNIYFTTFIMQR